MEKTMEKRRIATRNMILCALFAALIAIGAFIKIPIPYVPITFQGFFVLLAGFLLGPKYGCISMLIYIAVGLVDVYKRQRSNRSRKRHMTAAHCSK